MELWNSQASNDGQGASDSLTSIENVFGSAFGDSLSGDNNDNVLRGGAGFDGLFGGEGSDTADYSAAAGAVSVELWNARAGNDGQGGADFLNSIERVFGSAFNDTLVGDNNDNLFRGGAGNDGIYGGAGEDTISYSTATVAVAVDLAASYALDGQGGFDFLNNIENIVGSGFSDYLNGSAANNSFRGGAGNDSFVGGAGTDTADFIGATAAVAVDLAASYAIDGLGGFDYLVSIENVVGSIFSDFLSGNAGDNSFQGISGLDTFVGGTGSDTVDYATWNSAVNINLSTFTAQMIGIEFNDDYLVGIENIIATAFGDTLIGDSSANRIEGAAGNDFMAGVAGSDQFVFRAGSGLDTVTDFSKAQSDKIVLQSNLNGSGITSAAGALGRTFDAGGNAIVDLGAGNSITLLGVATASLAASDFEIF